VRRRKRGTEERRHRRRLHNKLKNYPHFQKEPQKWLEGGTPKALNTTYAKNSIVS